MLEVTALSKADAENCPVRSVLAHVTGKWQVLILLALEDEGRRFGVLKRTIGDITQRVLTENLRKLERDGHLTRTVFPGPPVAVSYALTDQGQDLLRVLKPLVIWAAQNFETVKASRVAAETA